MVEGVWEELMKDGEGGSRPAEAPPADLGGALEAELASLREKGKGKEEAPSSSSFDPAFKWHALGVGCLVFISMAKPPKVAPPVPGVPGEEGGEKAAEASPQPPLSYPGPVEVALHLARGVAASGQGVARHVLRVLPVEAIVPATLPSLTSAVGGLARRLLPGKVGEPAADAPSSLPSYAVQYEHRSSSNLGRMDVVNALVDGVPPGHPVCLGDPDVSILASAVRGQVCLAVVPGYGRLAKLNLRELACPTPEAAKAREEREAKARARKEGGGGKEGEGDKT